MNPDEFDWSLTTWDGVRREQLRRNLRCSLRERLQALEDMADFADQFKKLLHPGADTRATNPEKRAGEPQPDRYPP